MSWIEPIYDRTQSDVDYAKENQSSITTELKGAIDYRTLNRIESNCEIIRDFLFRLGYSVDINTYTGWERTDKIYKSDLDRIINNINLIILSYNNNGVSEISVLPSLSPIEYNLINSIEYNIYYMYTITENVISFLPRLGFKLGSQTIGRRG